MLLEQSRHSIAVCNLPSLCIYPSMYGCEVSHVSSVLAAGIGRPSTVDNEASYQATMMPALPVHTRPTARQVCSTRYSSEDTPLIILEDTPLIRLLLYLNRCRVVMALPRRWQGNGRVWPCHLYQPNNEPNAPARDTMHCLAHTSRNTWVKCLVFQQHTQCIPYLDVYIAKDMSATGDMVPIMFSTYQKPHNKYLYIPFQSHHRSHVFRAFVRGELITLCCHQHHVSRFSESGSGV